MEFRVMVTVLTGYRIGPRADLVRIFADSLGYNLPSRPTHSSKTDYKFISIWKNRTKFFLIPGINRSIEEKMEDLMKRIPAFNFTKGGLGSSQSKSAIQDNYSVGLV